MAVDITVDALAASIRVGTTTEELAEITRLRDYAIAEFSAHLGDAYQDATPAILNEATVALVGHLYDKPTAARGLAFANAMRQSGAGRMLYRFRVHRAGIAGVGSSGTIAWPGL